jgi:hypothetical protein
VFHRTASSCGESGVQPRDIERAGALVGPLHVVLQRFAFAHSFAVAQFINVAGVDKNITTAIVRLDEAMALFGAEPCYFSI